MPKAFMDNVNVIRTGFFALDFSLPDTQGNLFRLKDNLAGNFVALCFFPDGDNERANGYLKDLNQGLPLTASGLPVRLAGICPRRADRLRELKDRFKLAFPLLSDDKLLVSRKYHVWDDDSPKPEVHFCIFVVDDFGVIRHRVSEVPGYSRFMIDEFRTAISKLI